MMRRFLHLSLWFLAAVTVAHAAALPGGGCIGASLTRAKSSNFLTVKYVAAQSPAAEAGIKTGDSITAINGVPTLCISSAEARYSIDGGIGSVVKLTVRRGDSAPEQISVVRRSALDSYLPAAKQGDPRAQFTVGYFYEHGLVTPAFATAADWYRKSAAQNYAPAEVDLAFLLRHGSGVSQDPAAAADWYLKAAKQGDAKAEGGLGYSYMEGEGVPQDDVKAFAWFYSAAQQDEPFAEQNLALLYRTGRGVKQDKRAAFDWYYRSAEQGDAYAAWGLAYMYETGLGVPANLGEAVKWYQKAQAGLPHNERLGKIATLVSLRALLENPGSAPVDLSLLLSAFRREILISFLFLTAIYVAGGAVVVYLSR
jgi:TPR repeat protein